MFSNKQERLLHLDSTNGSNWLLRCKEVRLGRSLACQPHQSSAYLCFLQGRDQTMPPTPAPQPATKLPVALHHHIHSSSSVPPENWEGRGDRSTRGPSSLPAQGQELTDIVPPPVICYLQCTMSSPMPSCRWAEKPITKPALKTSIHITSPPSKLLLT